MSNKLVGLMLAVATGCVTQHDPEPQPDGGVIGTPITPHTGVWFYDGVTPVSNDCNPAIQEGEGGNFLIDSASQTTFHVDPNDGHPAFSCTLSTGTFTCPSRITAMQDFHPSVDAIATAHVDVDGTFSSSVHATGTQRGTVDCVGSACGAYGTFPCHYQQKFAISAQ